MSSRLTIRKIALLVLIISSLAVVLRDQILKESGIIEFDTPYDIGRVDQGLKIEGKKIRALIMDPHGAQTVVFTNNRDSVAIEYIRFYRMAQQIIKQPKDILILGAGGYTSTRDLLRLFPMTNTVKSI
jgi:hypothetical protein